MGQLTEKETTIESGLFTAAFYAEYNNGKPSKILLSIEADGFPLVWGQNHHSQHEVFCGWKEKKTDNFHRLEHFVKPELFDKIKIELDNLIKWKS